MNGRPKFVRVEEGEEGEDLLGQYGKKDEEDQ